MTVFLSYFNVCTVGQPCDEEELRLLGQTNTFLGIVVACELSETGGRFLSVCESDSWNIATATTLCKEIGLEEDGSMLQRVKFTDTHFENHIA